MRVNLMVCMLIPVLFLIPIASVENIIGAEENLTAATLDLLDGGWLEERDDVKILHVSGTNYEMGYQYGFYLADEIEENSRMMLDFLSDTEFTYERLLEIWSVMKGHIPEQYIEEMQGMADALDVPIEKVGTFNIIHDIVNLIQCCGGCAWGSATLDSSLVHFRSADLTVFLQDSESGNYLQENQAVIVRDPDYGYASMYPTLAGDCGTYGGINEKGLAVSETTVFVSDTTLKGIPCCFRMRLLLEYADNAADALEIMDSNRTCGWNLIVSDGSIPEGYIIEQTANYSYVSTWDDTAENTAPFWGIQEVLRRPNCFITPEMVPLERNNYDISNLNSFIRMIQRDFHFLLWLHYRALSRGFENNWGSLDLNGTMTMLRDVYKGKTDIMFSVFHKLLLFVMPVHQWVATPEKGDMVVSFASPRKIAPYSPVHYFNLFKLLEAEPP